MAELPHGLESRKVQYRPILSGLALESSGFSSLFYFLLKYLNVDISDFSSLV
jgi:hypothetical protein